MSAVKSVSIGSDNKVIITYLDGSTEILFPEQLDYDEAIRMLNEEVGELNEDVGELKEKITQDETALGYGIEYENATQLATVTDNFLIQDNGAVSTANGWSIYTLTCSEGDLFRVTAWAYSDKYYYGFYNNSNGFISGEKRSTSGTGSETFIITAPENAVKLVVVGRPLYEFPAKVETGSYVFTYVDNKVEELGNILDVHPIYKTNITPSATKMDDYFIQDNGTVSPATGWSIYTLDVEEGDSFKVTAIAYSDKYYYAFYNNSNGFISGEKRSTSGTGSETFIITVPENAVKLVVVGRPNSNAPASIYAPTFKQTKWYGKKWVVFGDSLTEVNVRTTKHYFDYIADDTGITTYNMGNGGSGYASERGIGTAFYQRIGDVPIDADVITIFGSFNDLSEIGTGSEQIPLGNADDSGTTTLGGLINEAFDILFETYPLANLGVVTPCPWAYANPTNEPNNASAYCDLIVAVCKRRGIPCLDLFHCSGLRPWESAFRALAYTKDGGNGVHPDETGHKILAPHFESFLDTLLLH